MSKNWYGDVVFKMHFDMQIKADVQDVGRDFDADAFAGALARIGVEAVSIFAHNTWGWSFYPTKVGQRHPHCDRDLFGEGIAALQKRGIRCLAYVAVGMASEADAQAHPDWLAREKDGAARDNEGRRQTCFNSPYIDGFLLPQLLEIARAYPVAGFFIDGFSGAIASKPCFCESCRRLFGRELPDRPDHPSWPAFRRWVLSQDAAILARLGQEVRRARPDAVLATNGHFDPACCAPPPGDTDCLCAEATPRRNYPLAASFKLDAWSWRGLPCDIMTQRMLNTWGDWTSRPIAALKMDLAANLAHCAPLYVGDLLDPRTAMPFPGHLDMVGQAFDFARKRAPLIRNAQPAADVAMLLTSFDEDTARGAHLALTDGGWPVHILFEEDLPAALRNYQTLLIPNQRNLSPESASAIADFARAGGGLVVTGETSLPAGLTGVRPAASPGWTVGFVDPRRITLEDFPPAWEVEPSLLPIYAPPASARIAGAKLLAPLLAPGEITNLDESRIPRRETDYVGLSENCYGEGRVLWCALDLGAELWKRGNTHAKHLLNALVLRAVKAPAVRVEAPADLAVTLARRPGELHVHLMSYTPTRRMSFPLFSERVPPIHDIAVRLRCPAPPKRVMVQPDAVPLRFSWEAPIATISVPRIEIHGCVVAEF